MVISSACSSDDLADYGGDGGFLGLAAGQPAAFAGDELVLSAAKWPDYNGLHDSGGGDGLGQFL